MSAGTSYDARYVFTGPLVGIWGNVTLPAANAKLVLDANGHPPDGVHLGYTDRGATLTIGWVQPAEEAWDNQEGYRVVMANQMSIEATFAQAASFNLLQFLTAPANLIGTSLLTFGVAIKPFRIGSIVMVFKHQHIDDLTGFSDYGHAMIYDAINTAPITYPVTRRDLTRVNARFEARPVFSRAPTDQIGQFTTLV